MVELRSVADLQYLKIVGVGFRSYSYRDYSVYNLGYSHYLVVITSDRELLRTRRTKLICNRSLVDKILNLRRHDPYRGRGMQHLLVVPKLKEGKKR